MKATGIKNVIFDLGGVIINLSTQRTMEEFARLGNTSVEEVSGKLMQSRQFHDYEKGLITDTHFRDTVRQVLKVSSSDEEIDFCWNAMLLDIPLNRIRLLEKLRKNYRLFLLSNTNEIHLQCFNAIVDRLTGQPSLDYYFDAAYYSHRMKMRKPDLEIFDFVLQQNQLVADQTLFLDDNLSNLEGANRTGIKTFHVTDPELIFTLFE